MATRIDLVGVIGAQATVSDVITALAGGSGDVEIYVASEGGSVLQGFAIRNALASSGRRVVATVEYALSIASYILTAADEIRLAPSAWVMVHDPRPVRDSGLSAADVEAMAGTMAAAYARWFGDVAAARDAMKRTTWLDVSAAAKLGATVAPAAGQRQAPAVADLQAAVAALFSETQPKGNPMKELLLKLARLFRLPESAVAVDASGAPTADALAVLQARVEAEAARADAATAATTAAERKALLDAALADGRLTEALATGAFAALPLESLKAVLASLPAGALVPVGQQVSGAQAAAGSVPTADHAKVCRLFGHDPKNVK